MAACPARLLPNHLFHFARSGLDDRLTTYRVADCTGCGRCTEACPASLPLARVIGEARKKLAAAPTPAPTPIHDPGPGRCPTQS
ncbi:MAG: 4Fe-4S binding protein [Candidatus Riflebacteria bacterium]|nr:4Fe-4S binding protein [Candidatus Riflebacteria bacterium]